MKIIKTISLVARGPSLVAWRQTSVNARTSCLPDYFLCSFTQRIHFVGFTILKITLDNRFNI